MRHCKGQNILEYAILICIVISALLIMQFYVKRAYQGRLKQEADSVGEQYAPKHTTSQIITNTIINSESYTGGKTDAGGLAKKKVVVPDGMSVTFSKVDSNVSRSEKVDSFAAEE